jgi:cellulose synthase/poly-beta-1,6-N-acetylglucosamine synthase-like glycosyltransferase
MSQRYTFWLRAAAVLQILTALVHSLSFLREPTATNETEKQMLDLFIHYKMTMGYGFHPSMYSLFTAMSACFTLLYLFGGITNFFILGKGLSQEAMKAWTGISTLIFGVNFLVVLLFAFLPPVIFTGLVFICLCFAYATNHIHRIKLDS